MLEVQESVALEGALRDQPACRRDLLRAYPGIVVSTENHNVPTSLSYKVMKRRKVTPGLRIRKNSGGAVRSGAVSGPAGGHLSGQV